MKSLRISATLILALINPFSSFSQSNMSIEEMTKIFTRDLPAESKSLHYTFDNNGQGGLNVLTSGVYSPQGEYIMTCRSVYRPDLVTSSGSMIPISCFLDGAKLGPLDGIPDATYSGTVPLDRTPLSLATRNEDPVQALAFTRIPSSQRIVSPGHMANLEVLSQSNPQ